MGVVHGDLALAGDAGIGVVEPVLAAGAINANHVLKSAAKLYKPAVGPAVGGAHGPASS